MGPGAGCRLWGDRAPYNVAFFVILQRHPAMTLAVGTRFGPYEIAAPLGEEGSGFWRAADREQDRIVVLKMLPERFTADSEKRARLERQSRVLAGLNHANICVVHEIRREGDVDLVAMEFVEGQTLADRLKKGALPLDRAVRTAMAIAEALHAAHTAGVVHGHLKPSNIMLTADGTVKIVDFGLAKWETAVVASPKGTPAPDKRSKAALPDVPDDIVRYLAPERIDGKDADVRSDVFAFGAVLYEMVTGQKAFEGRNRAMLVAAISNLDPYPLSKTQPDSPAMLDHIAQRCLAKDPDDRWQTWHDLLVQLRWVSEGGGVGLAAARAQQRRERRMLSLVAAGVFLAAVLTVLAAFSGRGPAATGSMQFRVPVGGLSSSDIAISPDGRLLALVAAPGSGDQPALYVRPTGDTVFRKLIGTEGAVQPFWSPDSRAIGFAAGGRLKRVDAAGGAPKDLGPAPGFMGGAWGTANVILFGSGTGLWRVASEGGNPEPATAVASGEAGHYWPSFLPDGQRFLYLAMTAEAGSRAIYAGALGSKDRTKVMVADSNPVFAEPGYIVFHRGATLFAQTFDEKTLTASGDALHIADQLEFNGSTGRGSFDVSHQGALVLFQVQAGAGGGGRGAPMTGSQWVWRDRTTSAAVAASEVGTYGDMDLSPDGKLIAVTQFEGVGSAPDIWVIDWQRANVSWRVTLDPGDDLNPVWSRPAGDRIAFTTYRKGNADIYVKNANGAGDETPLVNSPADELIEDWSKDGKFIAYKLGAEATADIWVMPLSGDKKPFPMVEGPYRKDEPQFSYDGNWLAYVSFESGDIAQVYVTSFPGREQKIRVSKDGGGVPRWREDGRELQFVALDGQVMTAEFRPGPAATAGVPSSLFRLTGGNPGGRDPTRHVMSVTPTGQKFLVRAPSAVAGGIPFNFPAVSGSGQQPSTQAEISAGLTVIRNWPAQFDVTALADAQKRRRP